MMTGHGHGLRTPLKRVRGLGASGDAVGHWWMTRLTSVALIPLTLWFVVSLVRLVAKNCNLTEHYPATENLIIACGMATGDPDDWISIYRPAHDWVASPVNACLLILLTILMFHHAASGMQAVFEDYVHKEGRKLAAIYGVKAICLVLGGVCVFSILRIAFSAHS